MSQPANPASSAASPMHASTDRPAAADSVSPAATDDRSPEDSATAAASGKSAPAPVLPREVGGRGGLEPTRFGDWEKNGRCIDF